MSTLDWFLGRGIGYSKIQLPNGKFMDIFSTHPQAEFETFTNSWERVQMAQIYKALTFVKGTKSSDDSLVVLAGDFNMRPGEINYSTFFNGNSPFDTCENLYDSHLDMHEKTAPRMLTWNHPKSKYNDPAYEKGEILDYIMYGKRKGILCTMSEVIANDDTYNLSDHLPLVAKFKLNAQENDETTIEHDYHPEREVYPAVFSALDGQVLAYTPGVMESAPSIERCIKFLKANLLKLNRNVHLVYAGFALFASFILGYPLYIFTSANYPSIHDLIFEGIGLYGLFWFLVLFFRAETGEISTRNELIAEWKYRLAQFPTPRQL